MNQRAKEKTELTKILALASEYAVLNGTKEKLKAFRPQTDIVQAKKGLALTEECLALLFRHGVSKIEAFPNLSDELDRAQKGSTLSLGELLSVAALLRSVRIAHTSVAAVTDPEIVKIREFSERLYYDKTLEEDISFKIVSDTTVNDHASEKLYSLRREIRLLNDRIRARLSEYLTGKEGKYLQDAIVTVRNDRYVLPVRAEYKRSVKGFIHDRSASGATFFIEPEEVLEMNNELRTLAVDEKEEVERILHDLSIRIGVLSDRLKTDVELLEEMDGYYARAEYAYNLSCVKPELNDKGIIAVEAGRHPLIDKTKVVPVTVSLGKDYRILLISGPNTGGKTVTLKMIGLFCLMAMCGLFIPAKRAEVSVFEEIYCDIGDSQSIEESLSTFSSHMTNVVEIVNRTTGNDLILMDELGGGTDPEEGQALAKAVLSHLLSTGCAGVVTTHYSTLKEYAFSAKGIENACMEFDNDTLKPLYIVKIGLPGSSNAIAISRRLGLKESILHEAMSNLSEGAQAFENIVRTAEESRIRADEILCETNKLKTEWQEKLALVNAEKEKLEKEREKLFFTAKTESRRIINARTAEAEELLGEIEKVFEKETLTTSDVIYARTLKNKLVAKAYESDEEEEQSPQYLPIDKNTLQAGDTVFVKRTATTGTVQNVRKEKGEAEVLCGNIKLRVKISELSLVISPKQAQTVKSNPYKKKSEKVSVNKRLSASAMPKWEVNVIGRTVSEALPEVEAFLDSAVLSNLEEVRIVHGMGTGKLRKGIHDYLKTQPTVAEFRLGVYGEGDAGVTIVKLK